MLNILLHYSRKPDLQSYLFLRWIKNLLTVAMNYNIEISEDKLTEPSNDSESKSEENSAKNEEDEDEASWEKKVNY